MKECLRILALTGSLPWLFNNVGFALSVKKRLTKPSLLSYCCIIHKDTDVAIKLSLTEHKESSIFENVYGIELKILSFQKSTGCWIAPTLDKVRLPVSKQTANTQNTWRLF
jgi:hypothetical protein